jgi:hypothetical protein
MIHCRVQRRAIAALCPARRDYAPIEHINVRCRRSLFPTSRIGATLRMLAGEPTASGRVGGGGKQGRRGDGKRLFPALQQAKRKGPFSHSGI